MIVNFLVFLYFRDDTLLLGTLPLQSHLALNSRCSRDSRDLSLKMTTRQTTFDHPADYESGPQPTNGTKSHISPVFSCAPVLEPFNITLKQLLRGYPALFHAVNGHPTENHGVVGPARRLDGAAVGAFVFSTAAIDKPKLLLVQRAATETSAPSLWEVPGGAVEHGDSSVLTAVARELWEEAGLVTDRIVARIGDGQEFMTRAGRRICKWSFEVEVKDGCCLSEDQMGSVVRLDPDEHQHYVWATEEEVMARKVGQLELPFTDGEQEKKIWEAFVERRRRKPEN